LAFENEERVNHCEYVSDIYWTDLTSTLSLSPTPTGEFKHRIIGTHIQVQYLAEGPGREGMPFPQRRKTKREERQVNVPQGCCFGFKSYHEVI
jgi:hypothetical protein